MRSTLAGATELWEGVGIADGDYYWKDSGVYLLSQCSALDMAPDFSLLLYFSYGLWRISDFSLRGIVVLAALNALLLLGKLHEPLFEEDGSRREHVVLLVLAQV